MDIAITILKMLGGLAILIYGIKLLSSQLKKLSGGKLEKFLIGATDNPFKGLLVGFLITVATQSSAATTVIVVSLVNSGILKLKNAIPIIMGANIGTTMNSQILRLANLEGSSIVTLLSPATLAPVVLIIGLIIMQKGKKQKTRDVGQMILGLGLLFTGMITMISMASSLSELPILGEILQQLSNPLLGVLAGAVVTAIVQSSAATVGILQALSTTGLMTYAGTIPIILGQNIGTCVTSIFASIGGNKNAKRVAAVHLYFNLIGTIIFLAGIYLYQHFVGFSFWNTSIDMGGIANFHTIFNVVSTLLLFPFINQIEKLTMLTVREKKDPDEENDDKYLVVLNKLDPNAQVMPSIAIANSIGVIEMMGDVTEKNLRRSIELLNKFEIKKIERIQERENIIDKMEEKVTKYLVDLGTLNLTNEQNTDITILMRTESEFEKVGDYVFSLAKIVEHMNDNDIKFSESANKELQNMYEITEELLLKTIKFFKEKELHTTIEIEALKELADIKREDYKLDHIERLKEGTCNVESGISFLEILTVFEKIAYHCYNIAIATTNFITHRKFTTKRDYSQRIYQENSKLLKDKLNEYSMKYDS
jgi:phosphate:Na+ symporter